MPTTEITTRPSRRWALPLVLVALIAVGLFAVARPQVATAAAPELVSPLNSSETFLLLDGDNGERQKLWVSASCRNLIIADGHSFENRSYASFGTLPSASERPCDQIRFIVNGGPPVGQGGTPALRLVTYSTSNDGWLLSTLNGQQTKNWMNGNCRRQVETAGFTFEVLRWEDYGSLPQAAPQLDCSKIQSVLATAIAAETATPIAPTPTAAPTAVPTAAPVSTPTPAVAPPSVPFTPATGQFTVVDGQVYDPNGQQFVLRGMNVWAEYYPYQGWGADIIEDKDAYLNLWNVNAMRLNVICSAACEGSVQHHLTKPFVEFIQSASLAGAEGGYVVFRQNGTVYRQWVSDDCKQQLIDQGYGTFATVNWLSDLKPLAVPSPQMTCSEYVPIDKIIDAYAGTGMVFLIDYHEIDFPNAPTAAEVQKATQYLAGLAEKYKNNPYVWFSPFNESLNECLLGTYGARLTDTNGAPLTIQGKASQYWHDMHIPVIDAIRATGNTSLIVANASNYGQDRCDSQGRFDLSESSIVQFGQKLIDHDPQHKVIFDLHFYSRWSVGSMDDVNWYFNELAARKLPVLIGEVGGKCNSRHIFAHDLNAAKKITENWDQIQNKPIGMFAWHAGMGFPMTTARSEDATEYGWGNDPFPGIGPQGQNSNLLTPNGKLWWDWVHPEQEYFADVPNCWS